MPPTFLAQVLAQELTGFGIEQPDLQPVPLNMNLTADPTRWRTVVGGFYFNAAVQMHSAFPVLVTTERLQRQWQQRRSFFSEHLRYLSFGRAVYAGIRPVGLPLIEVSLCFVQTLKAEAFQRSSL